MNKLVIATILFFGLNLTAQAVCNLKTLKGTYNLVGYGTLETIKTMCPVFGIAQFNGKGSVFLTTHKYCNDDSLSGTTEYHVSTNCMGGFTLSDSIDVTFVFDKTLGTAQVMLLYPNQIAVGIMTRD